MLNELQKSQMIGPNEEYGVDYAITNNIVIRRISGKKLTWLNDLVGDNINNDYGNARIPETKVNDDTRWYMYDLNIYVGNWFLKNEPKIFPVTQKFIYEVMWDVWYKQGIMWGTQWQDQGFGHRVQRSKEWVIEFDRYDVESLIDEIKIQFYKRGPLWY